MKKITAILLALLMLFSMIPLTVSAADAEDTEQAETGADSYTDGDGKVTTTDVTRINQNLARMNVSSFSSAAADVDGDGKLTVTDASRIQQYLARFDTKFNIGKPIT